MKILKSIINIVATGGLIAGFSAYAQNPRVDLAGGDKVGGGGTGVQPIDDTQVVWNADLYVDTSHPINNTDNNAVELTFGESQSGKPFPKELIEEMKYVEIIMRTYLSIQSSAQDKNIFFEKYIYPAKYYLVDEIPSHCPYSPPLGLKIPPDMIGVKIACTQGDYTYLVKSTFPKLPLRQQAEILVHERIRSSSAAAEIDIDQTIAKVSQGLEILLQNYHSQQFDHVYTKLNEDQIKTLNKFRSALSDVMKEDVQSIVNYRGIALSNNVAGVVWPLGGGVVYNNGDISVIDATVKIGVGTALSGSMVDTAKFKDDRSDLSSGFSGNHRGAFTPIQEIGAQSEFSGLGSLYQIAKIGSNVSISSSVLNANLYIDDGTVITNSRIFYAQKNALDDHEIPSGQIYAKVGKNVVLDQANLGLHVGGFREDMFGHVNSKFDVQDGVSLKKLDLIMSAERILSNASTVPLVLSVFSFMLLTEPMHMLISSTPIQVWYTIGSDIKFDGATESPCSWPAYTRWIESGGRRVSLQKYNQLLNCKAL